MSIGNPSIPTSQGLFNFFPELFAKVIDVMILLRSFSLEGRMLGENPICPLGWPGQWSVMHSPTGNGGRPEYTRVREDLRTVIHDGELLLRRGFQVAKHRARSAGSRTDELIREYPYQSMAVMLGVGLLFGMIAAGLLISRRIPELPGRLS